MKNINNTPVGDIAMTVVDYGMGNIFSVVKALEKYGANVTLTDDLDFIRESGVLILPGDGAFGAAMDNLKKKEMLPIIKNHVASNKWLFGICVGFQILFEMSTEFGNHQGLGILRGSIKRFQGDFTIPHMGWNQVKILDTGHPVLRGLDQNTNFYFIHSYYAVCEEEKSILGNCDYHGNFTAIAGRDKIFGTQFHPEKSHEDGLRIIENFCKAVQKE